MTDNPLQYFLTSQIDHVFSCIKMSWRSLFLEKGNLCKVWESAQLRHIWVSHHENIISSLRMLPPPPKKYNIKTHQANIWGGLSKRVFCAEHPPPNLRQVVINSRCCSNNIARQLWGGWAILGITATNYFTVNNWHRQRHNGHWEL